MRPMRRVAPDFLVCWAPAPLVPWTAEGQQRRSPLSHAARYVPNRPSLAVAAQLPVDAALFTQPVSTWVSGVRDAPGFE